MRYRGLLVLVMGLVLAGCAGVSTLPTSAPASLSKTAAPTAAPSVAPTGPVALRAGALPPGDYTTTTFRPTLRFTLQDGWRGLFPDDADEVALEAPDGVFFAITRVTKVVDPATGFGVDAPDDLVAWLTEHPRLMAEEPQPVSLANIEGRQVDATTTSSSDLGLFAYETGNMRLPPGVTYRCLVLPLDGPDLTIVVGAPTAGFADAVEMVQPVLKSLEFDSGG